MKTVVAVVDANRQHADLLSATLRDLYAVNVYDTPGNALAGLHLARPGAILVGPRVGSVTGVSFLRELRRDIFLADIPVIAIVDADDPRQAYMLRELGVINILTKPYSRAALFEMLSGSLGAAVGQGWQDLPAPQRKALDGVMAAFNALTDEIAKGNVPALDGLAESSAILVEAFAQQERGFLLGKIKDHDSFTFVHSLRYAGLMALFGKAIGLPKELLVQVATGGLLHDIGMLSVPRAILQKAGQLAPTEMESIRGHVLLGEKLLSATAGAVPKGVTTIVTQHHEMMDGSGYPRGLKGAALNELAQMAAIIDIFCALTDRRPYRRTTTPYVALEMMATQMKRQLNVELLMRFREILLDMTMSDESVMEAADIYF